MGNHHSHGDTTKPRNSTSSSGNNSNNSSRKGLSRTSSGADIHEKTTTQLLPVEKLAKILTEKSQKEEGANGITLGIIKRYLFPRYPLLAEKLFYYLHGLSKAKTSYLGTLAFQQQSEKFLSILDDDVARTSIVKMFSFESKEECGVTDVMSPECMNSMLMCAYHISMDHYVGGPQMCLSINKTLKSVVDSCFHNKQQLSTQFVSHWLEHNCPRLLLPIHRYIVHTLATSYRTLEANEHLPAQGLELATPVLEQQSPFGHGKQSNHLLHMSMSWLLAGALPPVYSRPIRAHSPNSSGVGLSSNAFLQKLVCAVPSHWVLLYDSNEMGLGVNRFMNHVFAYRGPTLTVLKAEGGPTFCIASVDEWKDSHRYWGGDESAVFQIFPKFSLLDKGSKLLYLNTNVRGYPFGMRAGTDPRKPIISVNGGFEKIEFSKIPYNLERIEVWGCGDQASREQQLEIKKWQVKEAERQRCVKLSADDWLDHPDRYLLELAGRPQYSNQNPT